MQCSAFLSCLRDETLAPEAIIPSEIPLSGDDNASTSLLKGMGWSALSSTPLQPPSCSTCASELKHIQVPVPSPCRFTSLPKTKTSQLTPLTPGSSNGPRYMITSLASWLVPFVSSMCAAAGPPRARGIVGECSLPAGAQAELGRAITYPAPSYISFPASIKIVRLAFAA